MEGYLKTGKLSSATGKEELKSISSNQTDSKKSTLVPWIEK